MKKLQSHIGMLFMLLLVLPVVACGGRNDPEPEAPTPVPTAEVEPTPAEQEVVPTPEPEMSGAVDNLQDVQTAAVQIEAQGSFIDPEVGLQLNAAGRGSGFIIDESGIAVTNNHVVTGAALIKVWVGGESSPRNARVLGVSECSDLAVIDIDGDGYPYLDWYSGDINVGLDVYAAGFPLGDPEFTLTRGIVSKARTSGETIWASVDTVLEHDATINPGNSGGPLVDSNGKVVGVNYAGASSVSQYFAIGRDEAIRVIEQLRQGQDVTSIGVNGVTVSDGQGLSGIWVSSVKSGSPADRAGVKGGDIITAMEGLVLATDGTMADYCDILRSHNADATLGLEVLRFSTQEVLEGQLNGRELETTFSFAQTFNESVPAGNESTGTAGYSGYRSVTDDTGTLRMDVPNEWSDIDGSAWTADGEYLGVSLSASPDLNGYNTTWTTPGVFFGASTDLADLTENELLDFFDYSGSCGYGGRERYEDPLYTGYYDLWEDCGNTGSIYIVLSAVPDNRAFIMLVAVQVVSDADLDALDQILNTFVVTE